MDGPDPQYVDRPPQSVLDAEMAVAGVAITRADAAEVAAEFIAERDFWNAAAAAVFAAALSISGSLTGDVMDPILVQNEMIRTGAIRTLGDHLTLADFVQWAAVPHRGAIEYHAKIIADDARRRRVLLALRQAANHAASGAFEAADVDRIITHVQQAAGEQAETESLYVGDDIDHVIAELAKPEDDSRVIRTPWRDLDEQVTLLPGQLVIIAARPGGGKSIMGPAIGAHQSIRRDEGSLLISLEMTRAQMIERLLSSETGLTLNNRRLLRAMDVRGWNKLHNTAADLRDIPLVIEARSNVSLAHIRSRLRWMQARHTTRVVVVDYLQLMSSGQRVERRDLEVAEFARGLKRIALDMDVCVIACAQLNRGPELRVGRKPILADLRESGEIENSADTVLLLHHEAGDDVEHPRVGEVDVIVAKQRNGPQGVEIPLAWQPHYSRMRPLAQWDATGTEGQS